MVVVVAFCGTNGSSVTFCEANGSSVLDEAGVRTGGFQGNGGEGGGNGTPSGANGGLPGSGKRGGDAISQLSGWGLIVTQWASGGGGGLQPASMAAFVLAQSAPIANLNASNSP